MVNRIDSNNLFPPTLIQPREDQMHAQMQQQQLLENMQELEQRETQLPGVSSRAMEIAEFATELRGSFGQLEQAAGELNINNRPLQESAFDQRTVQVSDPEVAEAAAEAGAELDEYRIEVEELAREQVDRTGIFEADQRMGDILDIEGEEEFTFTIEQPEGDDNVTEERFDVVVGEEERAEEFLNRVAEYINERDLDVTARVMEDTTENELEGTEELEEGEVRLNITAAEAGTEAQFEIFDITEAEEEPGLMEQLELETEVEAQDARLEVEGMDEDEYEVRGDTLTIDEGRVELELRDTGEVVAEVGPDTETVREGIDELVGAFNEAIEFLEDREEGGELGRLRDRLVGIAGRSSGELSNIGIDVDSEGRISVRDEVLEESIENRLEDVEQTLGESRGFASRVDRVAEDVLRTPPSRFAEEIEFGGDEEDELDILELDDYATYDPTGRNMFPTAMQAGAMMDFYM